jgi:hypothetical protein
MQQALDVDVVVQIQKAMNGRPEENLCVQGLDASD